MAERIKISEGTAEEFDRNGAPNSFYPNMTYVAKINGEIIGHISGHIVQSNAGEDYMDVHNLWVDTSRRSRGIATALMKHVYDKAKAANLKKITCTINPATIAKFEQLIKQHGIKFKQGKSNYASYDVEEKPPESISYEIDVK